MADFDAASWNALIAVLPGAHILQTWQWAQFKAPVGWQMLPQVWRGPDGQPQAAAMVLQRRIPLPGLGARLSVLYAPKGPLLDWSDERLRRRVLADLAGLAKRQGGIFIKIDPDVRLGAGAPDEPGAFDDPLGGHVLADLLAAGWRLSDEQIQFRNTMLLDLAQPPEALLAGMHQKARYNLRLAERKGVTVRPAEPADFALLYHMYAETAARDGFVIREEAYYLRLWQLMYQAGMAEALLAEVEGEPVAGVVIFRFAGRAIYMYGMSRPAHREKMPNHLLQWQAVLRAQAAGCTVYDLWGAPDVFDESDSLWGVYRFKLGLGAQVYRGLGAWDLPTRPLIYPLYTRLLPRLLDLMRSRGRARVQRTALS
ncbi:MAG: lipid II:glycine glycyltransferase FemX [Chloroflexota bacterium]